LKIWSKVQEELPHWQLKIVGDGPDRTMAETMIRELGLRRVSLEGWRSDTAAYYQEASVLCLVSQYEGWPLALTEAQANGVIPIAFDCCDGVREILSPEGVHGFTVEPFDEDSFARTLVRVAGMSEEDKMKIRKNIVRRIGTSRRKTRQESGPGFLTDYMMRKDEAILEGTEALCRPV
jgi:glycosyltransferase involved in cell wall biosynthesis